MSSLVRPLLPFRDVTVPYPFSCFPVLATLVCRFIFGPLVDRFGPRYTMAAILIMGAIPSGLAGTISNAGGRTSSPTVSSSTLLTHSSPTVSSSALLTHSTSVVYAIRFFIGILGATFVPCLAWTTTFYDKSIVGTANSFVGGWGNLGGGVTFLVEGGMSGHSAWRTAFAIVPVPILLIVAAATLFFGTDHPAGPSLFPFVSFAHLY
jgi:NNP family nitrate/nitrite transporter-like MFS transporter